MAEISNKNSIWEYIRNLGIALYFLILFVERLLAVIFPFVNRSYSFTGGGFLDWYVHILTILSLIATVFILREQIVHMFAGLIPTEKRHLLKVDYRRVSLGAGALLVGGMVHTNFTLAPLQFVAYGFMILSMIAVTVLNFRLSGEGARLVISIIYAICFAMAIPVVYNTEVVGAGWFIALECITSVYLVFAFTVMLGKFYALGGKTDFSIPLIVFTLASDLVLFFWRMGEKVNIFLIVFPILAAIFWIIGRIKYGGRAEY